MHAYDHTISEAFARAMEQPEKGLFIHRKGISAEIDVDANLTTFCEALIANGHLQKDVTYLKVSTFSVGKIQSDSPCSII